MKVAILAALIAGTLTSAQAFTGRTTVCRSYSDGVFSFIECADGTYIVHGPGGERRVYRTPNAGIEFMSPSGSSVTEPSVALIGGPFGWFSQLATLRSKRSAITTGCSRGQRFVCISGGR
jgi:hypothetical protein